MACAFVAPASGEYPEALRPIPDPPEQLSYLGTLPAARPALAIVGSRRPTPYGLRMARALATEAARAGWVVVSGLARGIDTEAHEACLAAGGTTWAVLGSGLDQIYPSENERLARKIVAAGGAVISEFPLGTPPLPHHFPRRNRIVAGLCWATVVVQGRYQSGSLITAKLAAAAGRDVFAVPGPVDEPQSEGPHQLLADGAPPVRTLAQDVWPLLTEYAGDATPSTNTIVDDSHLPLSLVERKILQYLGPDRRSLEEISQAAALDIVRLSTILLDMELAGFVQSLPGQRYAKKRNEKNS